MKNFNLSMLRALTVCSSVILLASCGGSTSGGGDGAGDGAQEIPTFASGVPVASNDFTFPAVNQANGTTTVSIPDGAPPSFSARRKVSTGTGNVVEFGDPVVLRYEMFAWSTGAMVESTDQFDEPVTVRAGIAEGAPEYLSNSLLGRNIGDTIEVVFEPGMEDLPSYLDPNDAYVLVIELM